MLEMRKARSVVKLIDEFLSLLRDARLIPEGLLMDDVMTGIRVYYWRGGFQMMNLMGMRVDSSSAPQTTSLYETPIHYPATSYVSFIPLSLFM